MGNVNNMPVFDRTVIIWEEGTEIRKGFKWSIELN